MNKPDPLTKDERACITALERVAKKWPKTLWLFAGDGTWISILKSKPDGQHAILPSGSTDQNYVVGKVKIDNDGGDW
jgi:hypothetical protein